MDTIETMNKYYIYNFKTVDISSLSSESLIISFEICGGGFSLLTSLHFVFKFPFSSLQTQKPRKIPLMAERKTTALEMILCEKKKFDDEESSL